MNKKIILIVGNLLKHKYFAIKILKNFKNSYLIVEKYPKKISKNYTKDHSNIINKHFQNVLKYEKKYFQSYVLKNLILLKKRTLFSVKKGQINNIKVIQKIKKINPTLIALNASSILNKVYIDFFKGKIINCHAGYMPYYRGSGCNVWAFYHNELKYVGVTIHFVENKIDSGNIIFRGKPKFVLDDNTHTIGCKNAIIGSDLTIKAIKKINKNSSFRGEKIKTKFSKLCKKKDFNSKIITKINTMIQNNLIKKFIKK